MRARSRREHHYQIPVKDAIWASSAERRTVRRSTSDEEPKVGDGSTRRRMAGHFWKAVKWVGKSEFLGYGWVAVKVAQDRPCGKRQRSN